MDDVGMEENLKWGQKMDGGMFEEITDEGQVKRMMDGLKDGGM